MDMMEFSPVALENEFVHGHFISRIVVSHPFEDASHVGHDPFAIGSLLIKHGSMGVLFIGFHGIKPLFIFSLDVKVQDSGVPWFITFRRGQDDVRKFVEFTVGWGPHVKTGQSIDNGQRDDATILGENPLFASFDLDRFVTDLMTKMLNLTAGQNGVAATKVGKLMHDGNGRT